MGGRRMERTVEIVEIKERNRKKEIARLILEDLPEWFGIPEAREDYVEKAAIFPMIGVFLSNQPVGFLSLKQEFAQSAEYYVLGVKKAHHRQGIGKGLCQFAEKWCAERGVQYIQVKTLAADHPDPFYQKTRLFYEKIGFVPLEVFAELWGVENPCLLMIKKVEGNADE